MIISCYIGAMGVHDHVRGTRSRRFCHLSAVLAVIITFGLVACTSDDWWEEHDNADALHGALDRFATDNVRKFDYFNIRRINEFFESGPASTSSGITRLWLSAFPDFLDFYDLLPTQTGVDVFTANSMAVSWPIDDDQRRDYVMLLEGGQHDEIIRTAARQSDWSGDEVLSRSDRSAGISSFSQLRPMDEDAALGAGNAEDLSIVDGSGPTLIDHPITAALVDCAGDVVLASLVPPRQSRPDYAYLRGLRFKPDDPATFVEVACIYAQPGEVTEIAESLDEDPPADSVDGVTYTIINDNIIQVIIIRTPGANPFEQESRWIIR